LDRSETRSMRQLRHVTQAVVDQVLSEPGSLIALTTIKDFDGYLISHSANVAILSVILGQRLGMSKARLGELCLAAFLHDVGKLEIDPDILNKTGRLDEDEWEEMRRHPALAARTLLQELRQNDASMAAVVVAFEHHLRYDLTGYPTPRIRKELSLFSRIVSIADVFDAMTTPRVYRGRNFTPYETLNFIIRNSSSQFDPVLVKLFAEIMGLYPCGTVVRLTTGELGVVCEPPVVGAPLDRPRVRVLSGEEPGRVLDLDERLAGEYLHSVGDVVNPANQGSMPAIELSLLEAIA